MAGTPDGIQLIFSKPMNAVQASNVHNYAVRETLTTTSGTDDFLASAVGILTRDGSFGGGVSTSKSTMSVPLRSANYDPATFRSTPSDSAPRSDHRPAPARRGSPAKPREGPGTPASSTVEGKKGVA